MIRFYLVPRESSLDGTRFGAKYFDYRGDPDPPGLVTGVSVEQHFFGDHPWVLVAADTDDTQNAAMLANTDVLVFPDNLDTRIGADIGRVQAFLENMTIPGSVLTSNDFYRQTLRGIRGIFAMIDCMEDKGFNTSAVSLDTTVGSLSAAAIQGLRDCAAGLGFNVGRITGSSTIRDVYRTVAAQTKQWSMLGVLV